MKRKLLTIMMASIMTLSLVACGEKKEDPKDTGNNTNVTENNDKKDDDKKDEDKKDEYKPLDKVGVNDFNKQVVGKFEKLLKDKGFEVEVREKRKEKETQEGPCVVKYESGGQGTKPYYGGIYYSASAYPGVAYLGYDFYYFVDPEKIKNGEHKVPTAEELLIQEPYKILTGKDMSADSLKKINDVFKEAYVDGREQRDVEIEIEGVFKVKVSTTLTKLEFSIKSDGDGE